MLQFKNITAAYALKWFFTVTHSVSIEGKEVQTASVRRNLYSQRLEALCRTIMMVAALSAGSSAIN